MEQKSEYDSPEVGTVFMLRSRYSEDPRLNPIKKLASILEEKGMISWDMQPVGYTETLKIRLSDYAKKLPTRKYSENWIDGGKQISVFHPHTCLPFFFNKSGSRICKLCDGKHCTEDIITMSKKEWPSLTNNKLVIDLMRFLLLLEELDLIEFVE